MDNKQKCRLLKKAILELPTARYDYVISVLEEKLEELKQVINSERMIEYPTCPECNSTKVFMKNNTRYCWDCHEKGKGLIATSDPIKNVKDSDDVSNGDIIDEEADYHEWEKMNKIRPTGMKTDEVCSTCDGIMSATNNQDYVYCLCCQKVQKREGVD